MAARDRVARLAGSAAVDRLGRADRRRRMGARILPSYHALRALDGGEDHEQQWAAVGSSGVAVGSSGAAVARQWCSSGAAVVQQWRGSGAAVARQWCSDTQGRKGHQLRSTFAPGERGELPVVVGGGSPSSPLLTLALVRLKAVDEASPPAPPACGHCGHSSRDTPRFPVVLASTPPGGTPPPPPVAPPPLLREPRAAQYTLGGCPGSARRLETRGEYIESWLTSARPSWRVICAQNKAEAGAGRG